MSRISSFFAKPLFSDKRFILSLWMVLTLVASIKHIFSRGIDNNYIIFKYVFQHTTEQLNLYAAYPYYHDTNHYGPVFSLLIAPFTFFPDYIGCVLWGIFVSVMLFIALDKLPLDWKLKVPVFYIAVHDMFTSVAGMQSNALIAALIIGSFVAIHKEKDGWAALFIALGFMVKLYGIVGLCFFFFSRHKIKLILYTVMWAVVFFVLPMLISSPGFIIQSYQDWYHSLLAKDAENAGSLIQDISVIGMIRRISGYREISTLLVLLPAMCLFALQYLKVKMFKDLKFRLGLLASTLLFVVLFSSSSESQTYVIAMSGVGIWFTTQDVPRSRYIIALLIFVMVLTSFSSSDLIPKPGRTFVRQYALKALPCFLVWLTLVWQLLSSKMGFEKNLIERNTPLNP